MAESQVPAVPDPDDRNRHIRAHAVLSRIMNDLMTDGSIVINGDVYTLVPAGNVTLIDAVFGQKTFLPGLPNASDGLPILASRVFSQRVSYGTVG